MLPIIVIPVIWIASFFIGMAIGIILDALSGKRLAVLGERGVGKTHLLKFLETGSISTDELAQTLESTLVKGKRFKLKGLNLKLADTLDVSGVQAAYAEWKNAVKQADIVLYLVRADKLLENNQKTESRIRRDIDMIRKWLKNSSKPRYIVVTHCDKDEEYKKLTPGNQGEYKDKFCELELMKEVMKTLDCTQQSQVIVGSMETIEDTETLVVRLFKQILENPSQILEENPSKDK